MKDLGTLLNFLRVEVVSNPSTYWIRQPLYTKRVLERFGMESCKPTSIPASPDTKLQKRANDSCQKLYQAAVGTLSTKTRSDITFAVSSAARFLVESLKLNSYMHNHDSTILIDDCHHEYV